ncbi:LysR family transcriptional regulator [Thalassotalea fusca]
MDKFKALNIFKEVAHAGSFSAGADILEMTPSAVSRYISQLESHLGVTLFMRTTRSLKLSDSGEVYLEHAETILEKLRKMELLAEDAQTVPSGTLKISAPVYFSRAVLTPMIEDFSKKYPTINMNLLVLDRFVNLIEEGVDLAIRIGHLGDLNLVAKPLGETVSRLVASPDYLKRYSEINQPEDLLHHNCLIDSVIGHNQQWRFMVDDEEALIQVKGNIVINDGEMIANMACRGLGVAYLPSLFVDHAIERGELVWLLPETTFEPFPMSVVYPPDIHMRKTLKLFVTELQKYMGTKL